MKNHPRYIFLTFDDLKQFDFQKVKKVSDRIYLFATEDEERFDINLVKELQSMGEKLEWIIIPEDNDDMFYHISFVMGVLHEKIHESIEFAILSDFDGIDSFILYLNSIGRTTIRIEMEKDSLDEEIKETLFDEKELDDEFEEKFENEFDEELDEFDEIAENFNRNGASSSADTEGTFEEENLLTEKKSVKKETNLISQTAKNTVKELKKLDDKPEEVSSLKSYILMRNMDDDKIYDILDEIIEQLEIDEKILISDGNITYNF